MPNAVAAASASSLDLSQRRLAWGLLVSLLLHGLLLALHFGVQGLRPGSGAPLTLRLARTAPATVPPIPLAPPVAAASSSVPPAPPAPAAETAPRSVQRGFTVLDPAPAPAPTPLPSAPPPAAVVKPRRTARRRPRPAPPADGLTARVIAQDTPDDSEFKVPPPAAKAEPMPETVAGEAPAAARVEEAAPELVAEPDQREREEERERLAAQRERERDARREADEQAVRIAAEAAERAETERRNAALAQQEARYRDELAQQQHEQQRREEERQRGLAQQRAAEDAQARQLAQQRRRDEEAPSLLAQQAQQAEQQREQAQEQARQQLADQRRAEETARQQLAEQQRAQAKAQQQLAEEQRARQLAEQQLVDRQRAEEMARQQMAEQQHTRQLAEQRAADERAQEAARRQQAEQLARQQAEEGARRLAQEQARTQAPAGGGGLRDGAGRTGADGGRGDGTLPRDALGSGLASRAREMLRGIDIGKPLPPAMRPAEEAQRDLRRGRSEAASRDVPLRMYIDSVRQKIERNAIVGENLLAEGLVRTFPIVSVAIRSDGSIEDVTIVRSSGRPDIDEVVRRTVNMNARYAAFPPNVAAHYDVIELRRVWSFAGVLKLLEEMR